MLESLRWTHSYPTPLLNEILKGTASHSLAEIEKPSGPLHVYNSHVHDLQAYTRAWHMYVHDACHGVRTDMRRLSDTHHGSTARDALHFFAASQ
jgi:hypothetical protein